MTPKTVAIGAVLVLFGVLLGMNFPIAEAQPADGPYALSAVNLKAVWRLNQRTGQVSLCLVNVTSPDWEAETPTPRQKARLTPRCTPWGPATDTIDAFLNAPIPGAVDEQAK